MVERQLPRRLFQHDLANVGRIHRYPTEPVQKHLGPTMLGLADNLARGAKALVTEARGREADAINVARRQPDGAREPDIERIQVCAFTTQVAGLEHRRDVTNAAAG